LKSFRSYQIIRRRRHGRSVRRRTCIRCYNLLKKKTEHTIKKKTAVKKSIEPPVQKVRVCKVCKLEKPISEYFTINNKKNKKVYYRNICKSCYCRPKSVEQSEVDTARPCSDNSCVEKKISIPIEIEISKPNIKVEIPEPIIEKVEISKPIEIKIPIEKVEIFKPIKKIQFKSVILTASLQKMMKTRREQL